MEPFEENLLLNTITETLYVLVVVKVVYVFCINKVVVVVAVIFSLLLLNPIMAFNVKGIHPTQILIEELNHLQ